ncbi:MAG TPA: hypothetical protein VJU87_01765 [Gemmatimonadaceae bacterium]|nr:hypothetical protein [Gemmatimonadaceae bacterium]
MTDSEAMIVLVGADAALLEGLSQSLGARGYRARVTADLREARELAAERAPLIALVDRELAARSPSSALAMPLAPGGAIVLYHHSGVDSTTLVPAMQRTVMADLALPLERHRLVALVQHVEERARAAGRRLPDNTTERVVS